MTTLPFASMPLGKVLIVEDSRTFSSLLARAIEHDLAVGTTVIASYAETAKHFTDCRENYFAAMLDINLPDAPRGEVVDLVTAQGIPSIVFTGEMSDDLRDSMWAKGIVDYILKDNTENIAQVTSLIRRLRNNIGKKVLVVDDSGVNRTILRKLLTVWNYDVLEAADGKAALEVLKKNEKDVTLLITDFNMPVMDGIELVREVRRTFSKSRLPIIGLSGAGGATTSARFIKAGANDYMHKPFLTEEFYCRVLHNVENAEYISTIRDLAERDFLTGIFNRRSFFSHGRKYFANSKRGSISLLVALIDIDHFKQVNDTHGHDAGDRVIQAVAGVIKRRFREGDIVARIGGEEFCVACVDLSGEEAWRVFEELRQAIAETVVTAGKNSIGVTVSIGICGRECASLEEMIKTADEMLYQAKEEGRNRIVVAG